MALRKSFFFYQQSAARPATSGCCYRVLGLGEGSGLSQTEKSDKVALKKAFRKKATVLHPDVVGTGNKDKYQELRAAFDEAMHRAEGGAPRYHWRSAAEDPKSAGATGGQSSESKSGRGGSSAQYGSSFYDHPHHSKPYTTRTRAADSSSSNSTGFGGGDQQRQERPAYPHPDNPNPELAVFSHFFVRLAVATAAMYSAVYFMVASSPQVQATRQAKATGSYEGTQYEKKAAAGNGSGRDLPLRAVSPNSNSDPVFGSGAAGAASSSSEGSAANGELKKVQLTAEFATWPSKAFDNSSQDMVQNGNTSSAGRVVQGMSYQGFPFTMEGQAAKREYHCKKQVMNIERAYQNAAQQLESGINSKTGEQLEEMERLNLELKQKDRVIRLQAAKKKLERAQQEREYFQSGGQSPTNNTSPSTAAVSSSSSQATSALASSGVEFVALDDLAGEEVEAKCCL